MTEPTGTTVVLRRGQETYRVWCSYCQLDLYLYFFTWSSHV